VATSYVYQQTTKPLTSDEVEKESFRNYLRARGRTLDTANTYASHIGPFKNWCASRRLSPEHAATSDIESFIAAQLDRVSASTAHVRLSAVKMFFAWLVDRGTREDNPSSTLTVRKDKRQSRPPLSDEAIARILAHCRYSEQRLMFLTALKCGLRISELIGIRGTDIYADKALILIRGKGQKERWVTPGEGLIADLIEFSKGRQGRLFEIRREAARRLMQRVANNAGVPGFYPHQLRITFASRFIAKTHDLQSLQVLMGHSDPGVTAKYAAFDSQAIALKQMRLLADGNE
jgi:site-specific recombinase XerD